MGVKAFKCYLTYYQIAQLLDSDRQRGQFWIAVMDYMFAGIDREDELKPKTLQMAFINAKSHLKTSIRKSESGKKGNAERWGDGIANPSQEHRKGIARASQVEVEVEEKGEANRKPDFAIPEDAKAALIDLGLLKGERHAQ